MNREAEHKRLTTDKKKIFVRKCPTIMSVTKAELHKLYIEIFDRLQEYEVAEETGQIIVPPVKVGQTVYYVSDSPINLSVQANTIYEAEVVRIVTTHLGTTLVIQIHNEYGCTEIPNIHEWQKTVYASREDAVKALEGSGKK